MTKPIILDFETDGIDDRPLYPPAPIGVAVELPEWSRPQYWSFDHSLGGNSHSKEQVCNLLTDIMVRRREPILMHHGKFDLVVANEKLGIPMPDINRVEDTLVQLFLLDPFAKTYSLKPTAQALLDEPPEERDELIDWLVANIPAVKKKRSSAMRYLRHAPVPLVGKYAIGDVRRTKKLHALNMKRGLRDMTVAYRRELDLMFQVLLPMEREGVTVDLSALDRDLRTYDAHLKKIDQWVYKRLASDFNIDSADELADALEARYGTLDWPLTDKGNRSTSVESLREVMDDKELLAVLEWRGPVSTSVNTFMRNWLDFGLLGNGRVHVSWNSVRGSGQRGGGARTGRLSSNPNFQNIPHPIESEFPNVAAFIEKHWPKHGLPRLPTPAVRKYIIADTKHDIIIARDFASQELRVLAHFCEGSVAQAYIDKPDLDIHQHARDLMQESAGMNLTRKHVKNVSFGILYGMGLGKLAYQLGVSVEEAKRIQKTYFMIFPELAELVKNLKHIGKSGEAICTWGGRYYYCEPPVFRNGRKQTFEYKLTNYLIQGSSADYTKQAMIEYYKTPLVRSGDARLILTAHDELVAVTKRKNLKRAMVELREAMNNVPLGVPMLSDGEYGDNWFDLKEYAE